MVSRRGASMSMLRRAQRYPDMHAEGAADFGAAALAILSDVLIFIDPSPAYVTLDGSTNVQTFTNRGSFGASFTQGTAANRAAWNAADANFNSKPSVTFDGVNDIYALGDLTFLNGTAAEAFVALKRTADPPVSTVTSGLYRIGAPASGCNIPWTDGVVYETFATGAQRNTGNPAQSLAVPVLYNPWNAASDFGVRIARANHFTSAAFGAVACTGAGMFGGDGTEFMIGQVAFFILCGSKQGAGAKTAFEALVLSTFGC